MRLERILDHHSAWYNLMRILEEAVLLEDHYARERCADCIAKHLLKITSYAAEGLTLEDGEAKDLLRRALEIGRRLMMEMASAVHGGSNGELAERHREELRRLRKEIVAAIFGLHPEDVEDHHHNH